MNVNQSQSHKVPYVLAVDDEKINRLLLEDLIESLYELVIVESGEACLESVSERLPELILLDIGMPGISGFETCRLLKENPKTSHIPIIFLTAKVTIEDERKGLQLGAVDYITKPFSESILLARIETHISLSQTRQLLEKSYAAIQKNQAYIESIMLSMREDERFAVEHVTTLMAPVEKSSGDIVLSALAPNGHKYLLIGDFTGHGLSSAIAGPLVSSLFYTLSNQGESFKKMITILNSELVYKLPVGLFMAAIFIDWDIKKNQVTVWNFGMPALLHFRGGEKKSKYVSNYLALGIQDVFEGDSFEGDSFGVASGDTLFAYSDGIQEVCSQSGEAFGDSRIESLLSQVIAQQTELTFVMNALNTYANGQVIQDDITLVQVDIPS